MKRKAPSLKTKLASALLEMRRYDEQEAAFVPIIGYEESKSMTADQIIAKFHFDHGVAHAHGGTIEPWNLTPRLVEDHRRKTALIDIPRIAKGKRINKSNAAFETRMAAKARGEEPAPSKWPKGRKLQSRPFERRA